MRSVILPKYLQYLQLFSFNFSLLTFSIIDMKCFHVDSKDLLNFMKNVRLLSLLKTFKLRISVKGQKTVKTVA